MDVKWISSGADRVRVHFSFAQSTAETMLTSRLTLTVPEEIASTSSVLQEMEMTGEVMRLEVTRAIVLCSS